MPVCHVCCALPPACLPAWLQEPATAEVGQVFEGCKDLGLLLGKGGEWALPASG